VNVKFDRDRRLFTAYLIALPLPDMARLILGATGVMGTGKSTLSRFVKRAVDPSVPDAVRFDKPAEVLPKQSHCQVLMIDNASSFPERAEDMVCRLVTGEADSKRQFYTDDHDIIYGEANDTPELYYPAIRA
jgi:hypothetical protein